MHLTSTEYTPPQIWGHKSLTIQCTYYLNSSCHLDFILLITDTVFQRARWTGSLHMSIFETPGLRYSYGHWATYPLYTAIPMTPIQTVSHLSVSWYQEPRGLRETQINIPQAGLPPALPVVLESGCPPLPRSSVPPWTTTVRYCNNQHLFSSNIFGMFSGVYHVRQWRCVGQSTWFACR